MAAISPASYMTVLASVAACGSPFENIDTGRVSSARSSVSAGSTSSARLFASSSGKGNGPFPASTTVP